MAVLPNIQNVLSHRYESWQVSNNIKRSFLDIYSGYRSFLKIGLWTFQLKTVLNGHFTGFHLTVKVLPEHFTGFHLTVKVLPGHLTGFHLTVKVLPAYLTGFHFTEKVLRCTIKACNK